MLKMWRVGETEKPGHRDNRLTEESMRNGRKNGWMQ